MAVFLLTPLDETFERVRALTGIARVILTIRLVFGLLVTIWLALSGGNHALLVSMIVAMALLLLVMLRWNTIGWILLTHPIALAIDGGLCFLALEATKTLSPLILLSGTGALLTGVCLDRRGAAYFTPLYAAGWWLVYSFRTDVSTEPAEVYLQLLVVPALLVGALFLGAGIRGVVLQAAQTEQRLREETRTAGVAEERARMAREMHDSLIKSLYGLALIADALPGWIDRSPEKAQVQARQLAELIKTAGKESRAMILTMRRADARASVAEQLRQSVTRWRATTGRDLEFVVDGEPVLPTESSYELTAILGEALENVRRHTDDDDRVSVRVEQREHWVHLDVADTGQGLDVDEREPGAHFGLLGMRERAARAGGQLTIVSKRGSGTTVSVRIPAVLAVDTAYDFEDQNALVARGKRT